MATRTAGESYPNVIHFSSEKEGVLCCSKFAVKKTSKESEVTCNSCKKRLKRKA